MFTLHSDQKKKSLMIAMLLTLMTVLLTGCSIPPPAISQATPLPSLPTSTVATVPSVTRVAQVEPQRVASSMAYDAKNRVVVLFGGGEFVDTWTWDGHTWDQVYPSSVPPARSGASMAYDAAMGQIVLFGGMSIDGYPLNDTWTWDGTNWLPLHPEPSPSARSGANMVYDAVNQRLVLFGGALVGSNHADIPIADTWTWDGTNWQQQQPVVSPPARTQASMTFDAVNQRVVLFGGVSGKELMSDTWIWDGTNWTQQHPHTVPPARASASMVYDDASKQAILFAGMSHLNSEVLSDTWIWDGTNWKQSTVQNTPKSLYTIAVYSQSQQMIVAYIVSQENQTTEDSETWLWDGKMWTLSQ